MKRVFICIILLGILLTTGSVFWPSVQARITSTKTGSELLPEGKQVTQSPRASYPVSHAGLPKLRSGKSVNNGAYSGTRKKISDSRKERSLAKDTSVVRTDNSLSLEQIFIKSLDGRSTKQLEAMAKKVWREGSIINDNGMELERLRAQERCLERKRVAQLKRGKDLRNSCEQAKQNLDKHIEEINKNMDPNMAKDPEVMEIIRQFEKQIAILTKKAETLNKQAQENDQKLKGIRNSIKILEIKMTMLKNSVSHQNFSAHLAIH